MDTVFFWIIAAILTAAVTLGVLWPLLRKREATAPLRAEYDAEIFGAQLSELKADLGRGTISAEDAAVARAEIGRRLLKADAQVISAPASPKRTSRLAAALSILFVAAALPAASVLLYSDYGSPAMPDLPLQARLAIDPAKADLPTLVAQAEARLRANPDDGAGWDMLGPIYLRSGRANEAAAAFGNAIRLLGPTAEREASLGEAEAQAAEGEVTDLAKASFERALQLNPDYLPAKFFLALDLSQENRFAEALPAWKALVAASPPSAPWLQIAGMAVSDAETKLAAANASPQSGVAAATPRGPTGEDVAAASGMAEEDRTAMIEGMVSQLADRLKTAPNDLEGWKRLMQSYNVLGEPERARSAYAAASAVFAAGTSERGALDTFAAGLGLGAAPETTTQ